jgi:hypothetical protein
MSIYFFIKLNFLLLLIVAKSLDFFENAVILEHIFNLAFFYVIKKPFYLKKKWIFIPYSNMLDNFTGISFSC